MTGTVTPEQLRQVMRSNDLNRRVEVEQELLNMAVGKTPLPTAEDCRRMALHLGVPEIWKAAQVETMTNAIEQRDREIAELRAEIESLRAQLEAKSHAA